MARRVPAPLILTLVFLVFLIGLLLVGSLLVRAILTESFADAEQTRTARILAADALRGQLDEETGVRGYAATRDPILLAPYYEGLANLPRLLQRVRSAVEALRLREAVPLVDDATNTNRRWLAHVAKPLRAGKKQRHLIELRGKILVDRFRIDMGAIDRLLARSARLGDARAEHAIAWANVFALGAVLAVAAASAIFTIQQYRLGARLEQERAESEQQRRQSAAMRAAFEAEKRIADTLQEAFAQRVLPELPGVRLRATYVPATEEAKIGGDWYDAMQLSQDRVLLAIGDVAGHGIEAAVAMNKARQMVTACALVDPTPGRILECVNAELIADGSPMITAIAGVIDARTFEFAYAGAGHPAPVLLEPGSHARFLEVGSLPLGIDARAAYPTYRVKSVPGAMLVLYTDGAIEHSRDVLEGETLLLEAVESAAENRAGDPAKTIRDNIFSRNRVSDDVAILTICFVEPVATAGAPNAAALRRTA
jgi:serine phosphatase RsbU (regulator of sigma subunit)